MTAVGHTDACEDWNSETGGNGGRRTHDCICPTPDALTAEASGGLVEVLDLLDGTARQFSRIMADERIRHVGSDPVFLAAHNAQNDLARARAIASAISAAGWGPVGEVAGPCTCPDDDCRETCPVCIGLSDDAACAAQAARQRGDR